MKPKLTQLVSMLAFAALPCVALAQSPQPAPPHETPRLAPPDAPKPPPEIVAPGGRAEGPGRKDSLSDRLAEDQGTLRPPPVDPGMHVPVPPNTHGNMPVIPPPGTAGGDQRVVPK